MVMSDTVIAGGIRSFVGVQAGSVMTVLPNAGTPEGLLGYTHFDFGSFGQNILPGIGEGFGSTGFIAPLPAGAYTFWIQDTGAELGSYHLNFQVSAVPEPVSAWMTLVGLGLICSRRRATGLVRPESESQSRGRCARIGRRISTSGIQTA